MIGRVRFVGEKDPAEGPLATSFRGHEDYEVSRGDRATCAAGFVCRPREIWVIEIESGEW